MTYFSDDGPSTSDAIRQRMFAIADALQERVHTWKYPSVEEVERSEEDPSVFEQRQWSVFECPLEQIFQFHDLDGILVWLDTHAPSVADRIRKVVEDLEQEFPPPAGTYNSDLDELIIKLADAAFLFVRYAKELPSLSLIGGLATDLVGTDSGQHPPDKHPSDDASATPEAETPVEDHSEIRQIDAGQISDQKIGDSSPLNRSSVLETLTRADRRAFLSYEIATFMKERMLKDQEAFDHLKNEGITDHPENFGDEYTELSEYKIPHSYDTWGRQVRNGRNALGEQKYRRRDKPTARQGRSGKPVNTEGQHERISGSIARPSEL